MNPCLLVSHVVQSAVVGYSSQGNLFSGTGYWAQQPDMPTTLTDHIVRLASQNLYTLREVSGVITCYSWDAQQCTLLIPHTQCRS